MYKIIGALILISACGQNVPLDQCIISGTKCRKQNETNIESITKSPDNKGLPGKDGSSCSSYSHPQGVEIRCTDGSTQVLRNGSNGKDGSSCSAIPTSNGAIIQCTDGTNVAILNGQDGADGEDGADAPPTAYSITEIKDPCGDQSGFDEVLLRTASGQWLAHFSSGNKQFLTILTSGTYITTDGTGCYFTLNNNGTITGEHN